MARQEDQENLLFTPVRSRRGRLVHATTYSAIGKTVCGKRMRQWVVATAREELNCRACILAVWIDCRPAQPRKPRKGRQARGARRRR